MKDKTMTFTARSREKPEKVATFTMEDGGVCVQLGDALLAQVKRAFDALADEEAKELKSLLQPGENSAMHGLEEPIPVQDFNAQLEDDSFQTVAWLRAGGLRLAPVMLNWRHVDNPDAAEAFVKELEERQQKASEIHKFPGIFDYWITWVLAAVMLIALPVIFIRRRMAEV